MQQFQDELRKAVPHLRLVVPVAAGAVWLFKVLRGKPTSESATAPTAEEEGAPCTVELPRGPALPFGLPSPLATPLLEVELPISVAALWQAVFAGSSQLLVDFHRQEGDLDIQYSGWLQKGDRRWRVLSYTTPLRQRLGPKQALNREVLEVVSLAPGGFLLRTRCVSSGVPFAANFANVIEWAAVAQGPDSVRLTVTGECRFHTPVWGPLKGQIQRESSKGMAKAYRTLASMLTTRFGGSSGTAAAAPPVLPTSAADSALAHGHASAASVVLVLVFFIILWRFALLNAATATMMQRLAVKA